MTAAERKEKERARIYSRYPVEALKWLLSPEVQDGFRNEWDIDKKELALFLRLITGAVRDGEDNLDPEFILETKERLNSVLDGTDCDTDAPYVTMYIGELQTFADSQKTRR